MASVEGPKSGREISQELNLVPFIDLMSVLITFLLITAVWSQVSMIQIGNSIYGKQNPNQAPPEPPPLADVPFRLDVKEFGYRVIIGKETIRVPKVAGQYDQAGLLNEVKKIKETYPQKVDSVITVDDEIAYENLITGMDILIKGGFPGVSVATGGSE